MHLIKLTQENGEHVWINPAAIVAICRSTKGSCVRLALPGHVVADGGVTDVDAFREWVTEPPAVIAALVAPVGELSRWGPPRLDARTPS